MRCLLISHEACKLHVYFLLYIVPCRAGWQTSFLIYTQTPVLYHLTWAYSITFKINFAWCDWALCRICQDKKIFPGFCDVLVCGIYQRNILSCIFSWDGVLRANLLSVLLWSFLFYIFINWLRWFLFIKLLRRNIIN